MARIGLAPILGYLIIEEDFNVALGVFALAGITDLVSPLYILQRFMETRLLIFFPLKVSSEIFLDP